MPEQLHEVLGDLAKDVNLEEISLDFIQQRSIAGDIDLYKTIDLELRKTFPNLKQFSLGITVYSESKSVSLDNFQEVLAGFLIGYYKPLVPSEFPSAIKGIGPEAEVRDFMTQIRMDPTLSVPGVDARPKVWCDALERHAEAILQRDLRCRIPQLFSSGIFDLKLTIVITSFQVALDERLDALRTRIMAFYDAHVATQI